MLHQFNRARTFNLVCYRLPSNHCFFSTVPGYCLMSFAPPCACFLQWSRATNQNNYYAEPLHRPTGAELNSGTKSKTKTKTKKKKLWPWTKSKVGIFITN